MARNRKKSNTKPSPSGNDESGPTSPQGRDRRPVSGPTGVPDPGVQRTAEPSVDRNTDNFSAGTKILESCGLTLSGRVERISYRPKTENYFHFVQTAYTELKSLKPEIEEIISFEEFRHIHALFLYARISDVEFKATGVKPAAPRRIPLPFHVRLFQPIFAILADLGVVRDPELGTEYVPAYAYPRTADQSDLEDISEIIDCLQYNWKESWADCLNARRTRTPLKTQMPGEDVEQKFVAFSDDLQKVKELFINLIKEAKAIKFDSRTKKFSEIDPDSDYFSTSSDGEELIFIDPDGDTTRITNQDELTKLIDAIFKGARNVKKERMTLVPHKEISPIQMYTFDTELFDGATGSYGAWVGWDVELWMTYSRLVDILSPLCLFSISFPKEETGTYAWLLPVEESPSGFFAKCPKRSIATPIWILSILLNACTLPHVRVSTWYIETDRTPTIHMLRVKYIRAAISVPTPTETFY